MLGAASLGELNLLGLVLHGHEPHRITYERGRLLVISCGPSFGPSQNQQLLKDKGLTCAFLKLSFEKAKLFTNVSSLGR